MFFIILFWISLGAIVTMLLFKLVEERMGGVDWWTNFIARADKKIHQVGHMVYVKYRLWRKIGSIFIFDFLPAYAYEQTVKLKDYIYKRYHASAGNLKGEKRMLRSQGSVSEFLRNVSEEEEEITGIEKNLE